MRFHAPTPIVYCTITDADADMDAARSWQPAARETVSSADCRAPRRFCSFQRLVFFWHLPTLFSTSSLFMLLVNSVSRGRQRIVFHTTGDERRNIIRKIIRHRFRLFATSTKLVRRLITSTCRTGLSKTN